ncbi:RidA family protein [Rhizobium leguminosarum]|uniref:Rid family hydrolase n=1 Tax=Rhizobium leguminosarum TaxID=384 RepID=UPI0021BBC88D|nr:Rid family hydrolase [Rhizobium leguminosarum]MBY5363435.1 RidA family protein [Rhizobium leguminosarum]
MQIERYETGKRMSQAVTYGGFVFLAGQVAIDAPGASVREQNILARITRLLEGAGNNPTRILSATIWLTHMSSFEDMNAVWDALGAFSSCAGPEFTVEIGSQRSGTDGHNLPDAAANSSFT